MVSEEKATPAQSEEPRKKKLYLEPQLHEYGSLPEVTRSGGSGSSDFLGMQDGMGGN